MIRFNYLGSPSMSTTWRKPHAGDIAVWDSRGNPIPTTVKSLQGPGMEALKRFTERPGIVLLHNQQWPPVALVDWITLLRLVQVGSGDAAS
jgi:hypothetical protein